jgi:hypothetical protein
MPVPLQDGVDSFHDYVMDLALLDKRDLSQLLMNRAGDIDGRMHDFRAVTLCR